jgi:hypothetical protein
MAANLQRKLAADGQVGLSIIFLVTLNPQL